MSDHWEEPTHYAFDDREVLAAPVADPGPPSRTLTGVAGWLLFLCVSMTLLSPLGSLATFAVNTAQYSKYFRAYPGLLRITIVSASLGAVAMGLLVYAGIGLWRIRPRAVHTAKLALLLILACQLVDSTLPFFAGLGDAANRAMVGPVLLNAARGMGYPLIWYAYLSLSKRVRATYPGEFPVPA